MILEVRHLRVVDAIQREGSLSRAAERLGLTQSAVSHALRDLENRLGVELFDREKRPVALTAPGKRVLQAADVVLEELRRVEWDLQGFDKARRSRIRVATQCYTCYAWLPAVLAEFINQFPTVQFEIVPEATDSPVAALLAKTLDLAILHERASRDDLLEVPLFEDEFVAVLPASHPLAARSFLRAEDFRDQHLILHSDPTGSYVTTHFLRPAGVRPKRTSQLRLTEAVVETVRSGLGITVLAKWVVNPRLKGPGGLAAVRLSRRGLFRRWTAALLRENSDDALIRHLVALIRRHADPGRTKNAQDSDTAMSPLT